MLNFQYLLLLQTSATASTIGSIIAVVAVFEIHIERNIVVNMKPNINLAWISFKKRLWDVKMVTVTMRMKMSLAVTWLVPTIIMWIVPIFEIYWERFFCLKTCENDNNGNDFSIDLAGSDHHDDYDDDNDHDPDDYDDHHDDGMTMTLAVTWLVPTIMMILRATLSNI